MMHDEKGTPTLRQMLNLGGSCGFLLAVPMIAAAAAFFFSIDVPELSLCVGPLFLAVLVLWPVLALRIVRKSPALADFNRMWTVGLFAFIGASLVCALFSALMLVAVKPGFIQHYVEHCIGLMRQPGIPESLSANADLMTDALKYKAIPTGMQFVESMFWFPAFLGSIYSMAVAFVVSRRGKSRQMTK